MYIFSKEDMRNEVTFQWEKMSCLLYFDEKWKADTKSDERLWRGTLNKKVLFIIRIN